MKTLKFGQGNAKLAKTIATFSLPAGHSCPFAKECRSAADRATGKIIDGKHCRFRCFAASQEAVYTNLRNSRWHNYDLIRDKSQSQVAKVVKASLPDASHVRVHVSGDFFSERYFLGWLEVATGLPRTVFYAYTKALPFLVEWRKRIPANFRFTASEGGTCDQLISKHKLNSARVVFTTKEASALRLPIDHDDSHAIEGKRSFALLLHGTQPAGSEAGKAWAKIKFNEGGYSRK